MQLQAPFQSHKLSLFVPCDTDTRVLLTEILLRAPVWHSKARISFSRINNERNANAADKQMTPKSNFVRNRFYDLNFVLIRIPTSIKNQYNSFRKN